ncbi:VWA domain-containing protein [Streptomyces flavofungini]|uniref:von Willebrand factor type A domain-containing protein n=1 Tax=Streptomyces flavofungini TaxID=68200 RepID=A0ABS0XIF6_9ACTN|nr:VWA domain-containing protein [Streptomyces flavofungini]MBJ3812997.1 von Willebrand factor type A domain-containing protein [Streptomyces flavofungini]
MLLAGCSGGGDDSGGDKRRTASKERGSNALPAPAPAVPDGARDSREQQDGKRDDIAPSPTPADMRSTFALDVDTASYGFARRTLDRGSLPDPATVRPEEFVNSFRQDYRKPDGDGFSVSVDGARTNADGWSLMRVGLATRPDDEERRRPPAALTFVIDISGSMAEPGRLDLVRKSLGVMTDQLRDDDSVALVTFSDRAETVLPMTRLGDHRDRVHGAVDALRPTASTNVEAGITTGYDTASRGLRKGATNRVVLLSDALANTGDTSADGILRRVEDARRAHGITLFGVGVGSDYGDALMERLADRGDGHTTYVADEKDARKVFCEQLPANIDLRARDAKAQVSFDPRTVERFRLIGYDNRRVADDDFRDDRVDGGEVGPGHTVTALYAVRTRPGASGPLATAHVRWLDPESRAPREESADLRAGDLDGTLDKADPRFQVAATAAYFADGLRSPYDRPDGGETYGEDGREDYGSQGEDSTTTPLPGAPSPDRLEQWARGLAYTTDDEDVRDLAESIRKANDLRERAPTRQDTTPPAPYATGTPAPGYGGSTPR